LLPVTAWQDYNDLMSRNQLLSLKSQTAEDLTWALCVLLYQALTEFHPFR